MKRHRHRHKPSPRRRRGVGSARQPAGARHQPRAIRPIKIIRSTYRCLSVCVCLSRRRAADVYYRLYARSRTYLEHIPTERRDCDNDTRALQTTVGPVRSRTLKLLNPSRKSGGTCSGSHRSGSPGTGCQYTCRRSAPPHTSSPFVRGRSGTLSSKTSRGSSRCGPLRDPSTVRP